MVQKANMKGTIKLCKIVLHTMNPYGVMEAIEFLADQTKINSQAPFVNPCFVSFWLSCRYIHQIATISSHNSTLSGTAKETK